MTFEIRVMARQSGKTNLIAEAMKKDEKTICIQPTHQMAEYFRKKYGFSGDRFLRNRVMTLPQYLDACIGRDLAKIQEYSVFIDEIGIIMSLFLKGNVVLATHTNPSSEKLLMEKALKAEDKE